MTDFLLELRCEEIPARMQAGARAEFERLFVMLTNVARIAPREITVWSTPRRLALIARGLPEWTEALREETKGPPKGAPDEALEGFCRKNGVARDQLELREVKGRDTWFAVHDSPIRAVKDVLAEVIPLICRGFDWPKSMRWGQASLATDSPRWVRPLSGIVAIFGEDLVQCQVGDIAAGYMTLGHRFHCPGPITIGGASDYQEKLRACHVIVDHAEREALIRERAAQAAADAGLTLVADEGLVIENAGLTEWPVPLVGRFDPAFLDVPPEVIQLTARTNQKYFVCKKPSPLQGRGLGEGESRDAGSDPRPPTPSPEGEGELADAFVCTANIEASDGGAAIVAGNRKVLAARLSDARFFWDQDRKTSLAEHAKRLGRITFHEKLGTVADKVERVAKLARWLVEEGIIKPSPLQGRGLGEGQSRDAASNPLSPTLSPEGERETLATLAEQAARLAKADLVTEMVGEFPELQGLMGGYYARAEGLPAEVADAIRDHYKPVGQGDEVPTAPVTVAVSLADKLDTLISFMAVDESPTGSKDPFALRRAGLAVVSLLTKNRISLSVSGVANVIFDRVLRIPRSHLHAYQFKFAPNATLSPVDPLGPDYDRDSSIYFFEVPTDHPGFQPIYDEFQALSYSEMRIVARNSFASWIFSFFADRLKVQQREAGVRHDLIDAVFALGGEDDLVRLLARVHALQAFIGTEDGANLHAGYKRAANILKKEDWHGIEGEIARTGEEDPLAGVDDPDLAPIIAAKMDEKHAKQLSYMPEPEESALIAALDSAEPDAAAAIGAEDFARAMRALASLRAPIDRFFDTVTVNDADAAKRAARLDLLARFRAAVHNVADFSRIEG